MKTCSTCIYRHDSRMGGTGCSHPSALVEDRVHGDMIPYVDGPRFVGKRDPHGVLEKCDSLGWHTSKPKRWWQL